MTPRGSQVEDIRQSEWSDEVSLKPKETSSSEVLTSLRERSSKEYVEELARAPSFPVKACIDECLAGGDSAIGLAPRCAKARTQSMRQKDIDQFLGFNTQKEVKYTPDLPNPRTLTGRQLLTTYKVIDPKWKYKVRWDSMVFMILVFTALVTPFEVAFLVPEVDSLFYINRGMDVIFLVDIIINFFVIFQDVQMNKVVYNRKKIMTRYLHTWFWMDLLSMVPFDLLVVGGDTNSWWRLLRLVKMLRLARGWRMLGQDGLLQTIDLDYHTLNLVMFLVLILFASHWMACGWRLIPELDQMDHNWRTRYGFEGITFEEDENKLLEIYVKSLYWSVMTITTIGYGDILPETTMERWYDVVSMLVGGLLFGYIIGAVGNVVQQTSARENEYHSNMSDLKHFMKDLKLPFQLQAELYQYFHRLHSSIDVVTYMYYVDVLSPALRAKMLLYINKSWITREAHFKGAPQDFVVKVASILTRHVYPPKEEIIAMDSEPRELFIVNRGIAAGNNRLFTVGQMIGIDALFHKSTPRMHATHAITYLECSRLDRENLFLILDDFPKVKKRFRLLAIKAIFIEEVLSYAVAVRQLRVQHLESMQEGIPDDSTQLLSWGGQNPFTATLKPIPLTPVLLDANSDHANSSPGSLPGSPPGSVISGESGTSLGNPHKAQGLERHKSTGSSSRTQQGPELSAGSASADPEQNNVAHKQYLDDLFKKNLRTEHYSRKLSMLSGGSASADPEQNNVVHKQHLDDLFKRNLRTEHYSRKLSMLYPPDPERRAKLLMAVSLIQKCMRNWRARAKIRAEFAEKNQLEAQRRHREKHVSRTQLELENVLKRQNQTFAFMTTQTSNVTRITNMLQELKHRSTTR